MFVVLQGEVTLQMRDRSVTLKAVKCLLCRKELSIEPVVSVDAYFVLIERNEINTAVGLSPR